MPTDNEMPELIRDGIAASRNIVNAWHQHPDWAPLEHTIIVWLADNGERLLADNTRLRQCVMKILEASACPEDVGFVEYIGPLKSALDKAQQFKAYVHDRLDKAGIPHDPDPQHTQAEGCRIGGRLDYVFSALDRAQRERDEGVYADIRAERARQDAQWGGPEHDDRHIISDWRDYRQKFEHRASVTVSGSNQAMRRDALVKIAALAVAQVEALDREHPRASLSPERSSRDR